MIRFTIIISKELNDWLAIQAKLAGRSKTKHIEYLLKLAKKLEESKNSS